MVYPCSEKPQLSRKTQYLFPHLCLQALGVGLDLVELIREVNHVEEGAQVVPIVIRVCITC